MRFALAFAALLSLPAFACSDDASGGAEGNLTLGDVTSKHATSTLRFTVTFKNGSSKAVKTIDSFEVDPGSGAQRATNIKNCEGGDVAPWLVKGGATASVEFTMRNQGTERMAIEAYCYENNVQSSRTAQWEFLSKVETNGDAPLKIAINGTYEGGGVWSVQATSKRVE